MKLPRIRTTLAGLCLLAPLAAPTGIHAQDVVELEAADRWMETGFEEVYRVGVQFGESWEMFGSVARVAFDEQGNLYVFDRGGDLRVLVFDRSGTFLREFGTAGEGPGEFRFPTAYAVMRDGTTIVGDMGSQGYHVFDESGDHVETVRWAGTTATEDGAPSGFAAWIAIEPDPRGGAVYTTESGGLSVSLEEPPGTGSFSFRAIMRHRIHGAVVEADTVVRAWHHSPGELAGLEFPGGHSTTVGADLRIFALQSAISSLARPPIFAPKLLMGLLPDGSIVYSDSSAYALKVAAPDGGQRVRTITRPLEPEPVTPRVREEYRRLESRRGVSTRVRMVPGPSGSPPPSRSDGFVVAVPEAEFYSEIPVIQRLATTWEGRIWVMRQGDELLGDGPIDVVTPDGKYVGTYRADATDIPDAFGPGGLAAFVVLDEFDVPSVVVRRLPAAVRQ